MHRRPELDRPTTEVDRAVHVAGEDRAERGLGARDGRREAGVAVGAPRQQPIANGIDSSYFTVVSAVLAVAAEGIDWFADIRPWIGFTAAQLPLSENGFGAVHWPQFFVSGTTWFALPPSRPASPGCSAPRCSDALVAP